MHNRAPPRHTLGWFSVIASLAVLIAFVAIAPWSGGANTNNAAAFGSDGLVAAEVTDTALISSSTEGAEAALTSTNMITGDVLVAENGFTASSLINESGASGHIFANDVAINNGNRFALTPNGILSIVAPAAIYSDTGLISVIGLDAQTTLADPSGGSGANFIAATGDEQTAASSQMTGDEVTATGIGDRFTSATASVLTTGYTTLSGALPSAVMLAAAMVTTIAFWYVFRRTRDGPNDDGPTDDDTILDTIHVALRSGMRSALGRVPQIPTLGTGTFDRGNSPLLA